jgi:hypothetical protein
MRIRLSYVTAALFLAFVSNANATIVGSTYNFSTAVTGNTQISPLGGPTVHTDPANPGFCVGPPVACASGSGVSGFFSFSTVTPTLDHITFSFFGSTAGAGPGSFSIDLGHFVTLDNEIITAVSLLSGSLGGAATSVTFNGTDAIFTWTTGTNYNAIGGNSVVFNVTTTGPAAVPLPAALPLFATGLGALGLLGWWRKRKTQAVV